MLGWLARKRRRQERALVLWDDSAGASRAPACRAQPHEGPLAFAQRAAARWPQFAIAFAAIGESYAALRYGSLPQGARARRARRDARARDRSAAVAERCARRGSRGCRAGARRRSACADVRVSQPARRGEVRSLRRTARARKIVLVEPAARNRRAACRAPRPGSGARARA